MPIQFTEYFDYGSPSHHLLTYSAFGCLAYGPCFCGGLKEVLLFSLYEHLQIGTTTKTIVHGQGSLEGK